MKIRILLTCLLLIAFAAVSRAQIAKPLVEDFKGFEKPVRNSPFSADAVTESVQILSDGTRITRRTGSKLYRDNEGRIRREDSKTRLGVGGDDFEIDESIRISDPVAGVKYTLDVKDRTFKQSSTKKLFESNKDSIFQYSTKQSEWSIKQKMSSEKSAEQNGKEAEDQAKKREKQEENREKQEKDREKQEEDREEQEKKRIKKAEEKLKVAEKIGMRPNDRVPEARTDDQRGPSKPFPDGQTVGKNGIKTKTESLGVQTVQGVVAEGTRITTTIPVGTIGNDRDINVVYEKWYSKELQMTVLSKHNDPRFGEQTYRLSNISRDNPPMSLFQPPPDYKNDDDDDKDRKKGPQMPGVISGPKMPNKPAAPAIGKPPAPKKPTI